jgi:ectoine hydroxylase-related dioxygenase (phytanoyl-CoA dioxygenase family)
VPGFHKKFAEWKKSLPEGASPRRPPFEKDELTAIPGKAGDFLVWHRLTPHANGRNESDKPRMAQYITMYAAKENNEVLRQERIASWRYNAPIRSTRSQEFDSDALVARTQDWDTENENRHELTALGKK